MTSRSPLRVSGEQECPVPPLTLPDATSGVSLASVSASESVRLVWERAGAAEPAFRVDEGNAEAVGLIAIRLDGPPLAIELAAARAKMLPPAEILPRLDEALGYLVGGSRDLTRRSRAWSRRSRTCSNGSGDQVVVMERGQRHEEDAVGIVGARLGRELYGKPGATAAPGPSKGEELAPGLEAPSRGQLTCAADKAGERLGQVHESRTHARRGSQRTKRARTRPQRRA